MTNATRVSEETLGRALKSCDCEPCKSCGVYHHTLEGDRHQKLTIHKEHVPSLDCWCGPDSYTTSKGLTVVHRGDESPKKD